MHHEAREAMERRRARLAEAAGGLGQLRRAVCEDEALRKRLDEIVGGRAIEILVIGASELSMEAMVVERELARREGS
jgi:hypothetical protein